MRSFGTVACAAALLATAPLLAQRSTWRVAVTGPDAFGYPLPGLTTKQRRAFVVGNAFFKENWVTAPASTAGRDGLGPLFNARSCSSCHLRDGRARPSTAQELAADQPLPGLLFRTGRRNGGLQDHPHPRFGGQLQEYAIFDYRAEGRVRTSWRTVSGTFDDGTPFELTAPTYTVWTDRAERDTDPDLTLGPRIAPHLVGLGLLEAVPSDAIVAWADAEDADGDGISGRAHWVGAEQDRALGRFGWKATEPTVRSQVAAAFANDIGITSSAVPTESLTAEQRERMREDLTGDTPELTDHKLDRVAFYCRVLAVPAPRTPTDPAVVRGQTVFRVLGCVRCHRPRLETGPKATPSSIADTEIAAFTDLLLHDLGPGLSDGKHDGDARPGEWRTPPLWGLGLTRDVNQHTRYLHDGRARNLEEAVLWHGGEAAAAQRAYRALDAEDRSALLAFLRSV